MNHTLPPRLEHSPSLLTPWFREGLIVILAVAIGCFSGMAYPALQSLMSAKIHDNAQGELEGALASTIALTSGIGPVAMTQIYGHFGDGQGVYFLRAPFLFAAGLMLVAIGVSRWQVNGLQIR